MGLEMEAVSGAAPAPAAAREQGLVEIYPLSRYYFGAKDAAGVPRGVETAADRALRLKANFAAHGLRTSVHGVLLVELFDHPHVLLLQVRNSSFMLPGGRLRHGEEDIQGLKRKLSSKLSIVDDNQADAEDEDDWQIGECIGMWWRSEFEAIPFPYMPPNFRAPKECIKMFLIRLPMSRQFIVPRNMKLLAVPLSQIHNNTQVYGPIISGIPSLLSKFSLNVISD
ncbi:Pre-mRNA cleavage factor Im 25 kDa subunit 1 [Dichanthelium oligosanthes]|uniref:Pre-mRNA cleavage factor Im 25 kDa subunit n=1 Tax=Dichanthelium oligosanthes TaxID=888268 RepID=A0A1E5VQW5_9POAL|nr:Pre-mRNA cleavage factor Im 25 kDa subunit 1 [Dichanthelium oligosanthes]